MFISQERPGYLKQDLGVEELARLCYTRLQILAQSRALVTTANVLRMFQGTGKERSSVS